MLVDILVNKIISSGKLIIGNGSVGDRMHNVCIDPFYSELLDPILSELRERGYKVFVNEQKSHDYLELNVIESEAPFVGHELMDRVAILLTLTVRPSGEMNSNLNGLECIA